MHPTLLIGLDGATFSVLDPLMEDGTLPFLREFTQGGVRAGLLSTPNPLTPPAWTSLMTGRRPGNHGIFDFIWAEQRHSEHYFTLATFADIKCETLWSIVSRAGGRVGTLNFPLMSPPPAINGYVVPGLVSWKHLRRHVFPRELYDELKASPGFNVRELAWDFDLEKKAAQGIPQEDYEAWAEFHIRRERQWFEVTRRLMIQHPTDLTAILFDGPDKMMHMGWRFLDDHSFPKQPTPFDHKMRALCRRYFQELDGFLAELVSLAGAETRVIMASDHGFGPSWQVFRVNRWLYEQGYLNWRPLTEDLDEKSRAAYQRLVDRHFVLLDWERTTAYARTTTSNGIYIRVASAPGETGVPVSEYLAFREALISQLKAITDPDTGETVVKEVLLKEQVFPGPHNQQAPDLTLVMCDHSFVSILDKQPVVCRRPAIEGTHYPEGILLARGPGLRAGVSLPPLSIVAVAPLVLYSLGIAIPANFEEPVPTALFDPAHRQANPVQSGPATLDPAVIGHGSPPAALEAAEEEQIFKQMRALGYME